MDIHCPLFKLCSGCVVNESIDHLPILNEIKNFFHEKPLYFYFGEPTRWRHRAKLAVRNGKIGLYQEGTHHVIDMPMCKVHHPAINEAVKHLKKIMAEEKISSYDEQTYSGLLRYIQCVVERKTGRVQLTLVLNESSDTGWIEKLWKTHNWHSIWINFNTNRTNTIFSDQWQLFAGESLIEEVFDQTTVLFHPASFAQANLNLFEEMVKHIKRSILKGAKVVEYYSGVGVIGLCLAELSQQVVCCEVNPFARLCFEESKKRLPPKVAQKISYKEGLAEQNLQLLSDVVIVDPPRKGLDKKMLEALCEQRSKTTGIKQLVYISCGWPSFKRDCEKLLAAGWKVREANAYLFFPGSNHMETLVFFD